MAPEQAPSEQQSGAQPTPAGNAAGNQQPEQEPAARAGVTAEDGPQPEHKAELKDVIRPGRRRIEEEADERDAGRRFLIRVEGDFYNKGWIAGRDQTWSQAAADTIGQWTVPETHLQRIRDIFLLPDYY